MKFRIFSFLFVFVFLFSLFASGGPLVEKMDLDKIKNDFEAFITDKNTKRKTAFEAKNFAELMRLLGKGPVITTANGEIIEDPDKIRNFFKNASDDGWGEVTFRRKHAIVVDHVFEDKYGIQYTAIGIEISTFKFSGSSESKKGILTSRGRHKESCPWD